MLRLNLASEPEWLDLCHGVRVRVVPAGDLSAAARASIVTGVGGLFEGRARIEVETAESVASASGKHRYVISRVADAHVSALVGVA